MSSQLQIWTDAAGTIQRKNYGNSESMSGIIAPFGASSITLQFTSFSTENGYDFVTVLSCTTANCSQSTQLGRFSGTSLPSLVTSDTGVMRIYWMSDNIVVSTGWSAAWTSDANACEESTPLPGLSREIRVPLPLMLTKRALCVLLCDLSFFPCNPAPHSPPLKIIDSYDCLIHYCLNEFFLDSFPAPQPHQLICVE
jgi:hypothetical protein